MAYNFIVCNNMEEAESYESAYGNEYYEISGDDIKALEDGKILTGMINDEYALFIKKRCQLGGLVDVVEFLNDMPTVDAVPVVRCRDCAVPHNKYTGCPKLNGLVTPPDFYCPFGRKEDN